MARLAPCPSCRRHVKLDEAVCPFCRASFETAPTPTSGDGVRRMHRVAAIALAAGVTTSAASCAAAYGVPVEDSGVPTDAGLVDAGEDDDAGAGAPEYGAPADDAGG